MPSILYVKRTQQIIQDRIFNEKIVPLVSIFLAVPVSGHVAKPALFALCVNKKFKSDALWVGGEKLDTR